MKKIVKELKLLQSYYNSSDDVKIITKKCLIGLLK